MATEAMVCLCVGEATRRLEEHKLLVCQLLPCICYTTGHSHSACMSRTVPHNFCLEGVVALLLHSPVDAVRVGLVFCEEKLLVVVESRAWKLISTGMEVFGVDRAPTATCPEQFGACGIPIDHDEGGDFETLGGV